MNQWIKRLYVVGLIFYPVSNALAWCNSCGGDGSCCRCPGQAQCLYPYSSCEEACGLTSSSSGNSSSGDSAGAILGKALGKALGEALFGGKSPAQTDNRAQEAEAAAAAERQQAETERIERERVAAELRKAEELRRADEQRQQELARQRILGQLKGAEPSTGLSLKMGGSDSPLTVTEKRGAFGSTEVKPTGIDSPQGLQLKLGDDADRSSMQARQGFDTAGKIKGSDLPPPPQTPTSKSSAEKTQLLNALKSKLKKNEAEEQSLKDQLIQLQQAPTPDPAAISKVQGKIVVKEKEKKKIMLDLTAEDPDAQ